MPLASKKIRAVRGKPTARVLDPEIACYPELAPPTPSGMVRGIFRNSSATTLEVAIRKGFRKMGGLGSGRPKDRGRKTVESYLTLDVNQLSEKGCLRPGCSSTCQWIVNNEVFSIYLRAEAERMYLRYTARVGNGERQDIAETISIVHLRCRFGGSRAYFVCPGPGDGTYCGRRITKLHLSRRYFLCRNCNQLAYASQYEEPMQRALRRASKLRQRLGIDVGIAERFPDKPKGMWARTYRCLLDEILQAEILANETQAHMIKRLLALVDNDLERGSTSSKLIDRKRGDYDQTGIIAQRGRRDA
jgi:hypothetical protein